MGQLRSLPILIACLLCACSAGTDGYESPSAKREFSILQVVEYNSRQKVVANPTFISNEEYVLLVVPNTSKDRNIWIMLKPQSPPFYKQMPRGDYQIQKELFDVVANKRLASSTVEEVLASHVAE